MITREHISQWFRNLQQSICQQLEEADGKGIFLEDAWDRPGGGGGRSRVMTGGDVIEKGGVNFSAVWGHAPEGMLKSLQISGPGVTEFYATGVSIVIHPHSPRVPIIHMNVRYFELTGQQNRWWFGGGIDLTPHYIEEADAVYFHKALKTVCDRHHPSYYPDFKAWADDYFYIRHRQETRGVGGIFFDHLKDDAGFTRENRFSFVQEVGLAFAPIYVHLMNKNRGLPYGENEKQWQYLRRGRYAEFNLVWDRGTRFGLETDGRTASILMSLPPQASWQYNDQPPAGSPEEKTLMALRKGIDWISE